MPSTYTLMHLFAELKKTSDGIAFVDSTTITVCHPKRISNHKVFAGLAAIGKSTKGWFYGLKLHLVCNHREELVSCRIIPGNIDDRVPLPALVKNIFGKIFGDKGYISQALFDELFAQGLQLITGIKKNMSRTRVVSYVDDEILKSLCNLYGNSDKPLSQIISELIDIGYRVKQHHNAHSNQQENKKAEGAF